MKKMQKMVSLDVEIIEKLGEQKNASALINSLLCDYFRGVKNPEDVRREYEALKSEFTAIEKQYNALKGAQMAQADEKRAVEAHMNKMNEFFGKWRESEELQQEYKEGVKSGKWRSTIEYAKQKISEG